MNDFKAGERVEYVGLRNGYITEHMIGQHGEITELENESARVQWDSGERFGVYVDNIRRLPTATPDVITIVRTDLPEVRVDGLHLIADKNTFGRFLDADGHRKMALSQLAVAEFLEREGAAEKEAAEKLTTRRNELAAVFGQDRAFTYEKVTHGMRLAIDCIIELEAHRG